MTNLQPTNGNRGAQPAAETDWLEELRGGSTNVEHLLRMGVVSTSSRKQRDLSAATDSLSIIDLLCPALPMG